MLQVLVSKKFLSPITIGYNLLCRRIITPMNFGNNHSFAMVFNALPFNFKHFFHFHLSFNNLYELTLHELWVVVRNDIYVHDLFCKRESPFLTFRFHLKFKSLYLNIAKGTTDLRHYVFLLRNLCQTLAWFCLATGGKNL